jgi:rhodanese-related sulfurtransferase
MPPTPWSAGSSRHDDRFPRTIAPFELPLQNNPLETSVCPRPIARLIALTLAVAAATCLPAVSHAQAADKATVSALEGYFDFVDANAGTILPEQIAAEDYKKLFVLDVRDAAQFAKEHVPGAANIEWRQVFAQRAKLPKDKTILVYCNTSSFAAQVAMALRMDGFENVRLLYGGFDEWKARGGMDAHARASRKS